MQPKSFEHLTRFPGSTKTNFDVILSALNVVDQLPAPVFALLLGGIAGLASRLDWQATIILSAFYFSDWLVIALLPRAHKSFGPPRPPTLMLALLRVPLAFLPFPWWIVAELLGSLLVIYGFWVEPHRLGVTFQKLESPKLGFTRRLRVLHLADIHVERTTGRERAMLFKARELKPDLILFSGDFLNLSYTQDAQAAQDARSILAELSAPLGVYAVSGSPGVDPPDVVNKLLEGMDNIRWLRQETATIAYEGKQIDIVGLDCTHRPFVDAPKLHSALNGSQADFRILLYHTPDLAPEVAGAGIDLQLSGHTHGGQVRIPFYGALYAASLYGKAFESGRRQIGDLALYTSRGIGLEGGGAPRVRFNCPPEMVLWELS